MVALKKDPGYRADMISAMAKLIASEDCVELAQVSVGVQGSLTYIKDFHVERLLHEATAYHVVEGTSDIKNSQSFDRLKTEASTVHSACH